jgi:hypothetical protein
MAEYWRGGRRQVDLELYTKFTPHQIHAAGQGWSTQSRLKIAVRVLHRHPIESLLFQFFTMCKFIL